MQALPGNHFVPEQFNVFMPVVVVSILAKNPEKRHPAFKWLIMMLASGLVIYGTMQRILKIHTRDGNAELSKPEVEQYFTQSLMSWIACIIMDGTQAYNIYRAYGGKMKRPLRHFVQRWTPRQVAEKAGLLISCLSMFKFGVDVYGNYHHLTHDVSVHIWFFLALAFKVGRIAIQGLVITVDTRKLATRRRSLIIEIFISSIFLLLQVLCLAQFNYSHLWISVLLTSGDVLYRLYQCIKINYHCCYGDIRQIYIQQYKNRHGNEIQRRNDHGHVNHHDEIQGNINHGHTNLGNDNTVTDTGMQDHASDNPDNDDKRHVYHANLGNDNNVTDTGMQDYYSDNPDNGDERYVHHANLGNDNTVTDTGMQGHASNNPHNDDKQYVHHANLNTVTDTGMQDHASNNLDNGNEQHFYHTNLGNTVTDTAMQGHASDNPDMQNEEDEIGNHQDIGEDDNRDSDENRAPALPTEMSGIRDSDKIRAPAFPTEMSGIRDSDKIGSMPTEEASNRDTDETNAMPIEESDSDEIDKFGSFAKSTEESHIILSYTCIPSYHLLPPSSETHESMFCNQCSRLDKQKATIEETILGNVIIFPPEQFAESWHNSPIQLMDTPT